MVPHYIHPLVNRRPPDKRFPGSVEVHATTSFDGYNLTEVHATFSKGFTKFGQRPSSENHGELETNVIHIQKTGYDKFSLKWRYTGNWFWKISNSETKTLVQGRCAERRTKEHLLLERLRKWMTILPQEIEVLRKHLHHDA